MEEKQEQPQEELREPTAEELVLMEKHKEQMLEFFNKQIIFLKVQAEYETLVTQIEEAQMRRLMCRAKIAEIRGPEKRLEPKQDLKKV